MDSSNTAEAASSSVSMHHNKHTLPSLPPSTTDAFLSLQLADYLDSQQASPPSSPPPHSTNIDNNHSLPPLQANQLDGDDSSSDNESTTGSTLLWVPADRHPEIAPSEFTKWLETNGTNTLTRKASSLRRKSSVLSHTHIPPDNYSDSITTTNHDDMCPESLSSSSSSTLPGHGNQQQESSPTSPLEFDRHSPAQDTSRVLVPPRGNHSLLRRKAFSARGRGRKQSQSRHGQHQQQQQSPMNKNEPTHHSMEPVSLYDRPVSMNEWIDLGSASLGCSSSDDSQQGILSRVHDAESQLLYQLTPSDQQQPSKAAVTTAATVPLSQPEIITTPVPKRRNDHTKKDSLEKPISENLHHHNKKSTPAPMPIQRASSEHVNKLERKSSASSWFGGLFGVGSGGGGDKEKKRGSLRRVEDEKYAQKKQLQQQSPPSTPTPSRANTKDTTRTTIKSTSGGVLGSFFSRNNNHNNNGQQQQQHHKRLLKFQQQVLSGVTAPLLLGKPSLSKMIRPPPPSPPLEESQKHYPPQQQQQRQQPMVYHSYRLPIHVERAIYRLSHYKLADPRRPLQHQVVISNLMFWYLSVINAQQQQQQQQQSSPHPSTLLSSTHQHTSTSTTTNNNNTHTILLSPKNNNNNNNGTLHAHFDDDGTSTPPSSPTKSDLLYKGQKTGRIGIPKPRPPYNNNVKVATMIGHERRIVIGSNETSDDDDDDDGDDDDDEDEEDDGDDDLPLSYYKQITS